MKTLTTLFKSVFRSRAPGVFVLPLLVLTACSKEVQKINHKPEDNSQLLRIIKEQALEGELVSFEISFDKDTDASLRAIAKREREVEIKVLAMRAELDALLQDQANVSIRANLKVLSSDAVALFANKSTSLYNSVILPYAEFILNSKFVENTHYTGDDRYRRMLDTFNRALVVLIESNPDFVTETKLLDAYWSSMSRACKSGKKDLLEMRGTICRTALRFFNTDRNTSKILQYYANTLLPRLRKSYNALTELEARIGGTGLEEAKKLYSEMVIAYYRVVQISLKARNASISSSDSSDLSDVLYLKGSFYLEKYFDMQEQTASIRQVRQFYANDFGVILSRAKEKIDDPAYRNELREIISSTNFWKNYSRINLENTDWIGQMFELATDWRMRDVTCDSGSAAASFCRIQAAEKSLKDKDATGQIGLFRMVEEMKAVTDGMALINNLDIETDFAVTDTVFLVDQLFRGHWSVSEAASYFEGMRPSVAVKQELFLDA